MTKKIRNAKKKQIVQKLQKAKNGCLKKSKELEDPKNAKNQDI